MILLPLLLNACAGTQVSRTQAELTPPATHPTAIAGTIVGEPGLIIKDSGLQTRLSPEIHLVAPISKTAPELQPNPMEPDLWTVVRNGFALPPLTDSNIQRYEKWYSDRPDQMDQMMIRARLFLPYIAKEVEKRGMPMEIALLPAVESAFKPKAYSRAHAAGLWQFIPSTGKRFGLNQNWWYDGRLDVFPATRAALDYLQDLHGQFDDWQLALAAYNAGENRVKRSLKSNRRQGKPDQFLHLKLRRETRHYVPKLYAICNIISNPEKFGLTLSAVSTDSPIRRIDLEQQTDITRLATLANLDPEDVFVLNPALKRGVTPPNGPHTIIVDEKQWLPVKSALSQLENKERIRWHRYTIRNGDVLGQIAMDFRVPVSVIKQTNRINGHFIRAGDTLLIPVQSPSDDGKSVLSATIRTASADTVFHRVRKGDTLWDLSRRYNVYISQLTEWNALNVDDLLQPGRIIRVLSY